MDYHCEKLSPALRYYKNIFYEKLSLASMPRFFLASAAVSPLEFACNDDADYDEEEEDDDEDDDYDDDGEEDED